jgi:hypothetical protein
MRVDRGKDGRTDMTKLLVAFRYFAIAPKSNFEETNTNSQ